MASKSWRRLPADVSDRRVDNGRLSSGFCRHRGAKRGREHRGLRGKHTLGT